MSKKNPIPALPTPVEKAIRDLMDEVKRRGPVEFDGVIIHPSDLPTLGALITGKPLPQPSGGALMKAYEEMKKNQANNPPLTLGRGQPVTYNGVVLAPHQVQTAVNAMSLEQQLEESLWAIADVVMPATPLEVSDHTPHMMGSSERIRRVKPDHVDILCPCKTILRFNRCMHGGAKTANYENPERCEEEVPVVEAGTAMCSLHRPGSPWQEGSRFYRCDYFDGSPPDGQCPRLAVRSDETGRHWCSNEDHDA